MAAFVLDFGDQYELGSKARRARNPIGFRQHADHLRVGVLGNLADERFAVAVGHPLFRLDLVLGSHIVHKTRLHLNGLFHKG